MATENAKPYQDYRSGYRLKDGSIFLAKCSPIFYGHVTPGFRIDADGYAESGDATIDNDLMADRECSTQYGLVAYFEGQPVGLPSHARRPRSPKQAKLRIDLTLPGGKCRSVTRSEFNRKVKLVWEPVATVTVG